MGRRIPLPPKVRWTVFARDGYRCRYCGAQPPEVALVVDHMRPVARGGGNALDNLITACEECNQGKSDALAPLVDDVRLYHDAATRVIEWLQAIWMAELGESWVPDERTLLEVVTLATTFGRADEAVRTIAQRLRDGRLDRAPHRRSAVMDVLVWYADWLGQVEGWVEMHGADPQVSRAQFWTSEVYDRAWLGQETQ